eukprot:COSAG01_NODE_2425_length_7679_cov_96.031221_10_plen_118_part_00
MSPTYAPEVAAYLQVTSSSMLASREEEGEHIYAWGRVSSSLVLQSTVALRTQTASTQVSPCASQLGPPSHKVHSAQVPQVRGRHDTRNAGHVQKDEKAGSDAMSDLTASQKPTMLGR